MKIKLLSVFICCLWIGISYSQSSKYVIHFINNSVSSGKNSFLNIVANGHSVLQEMRTNEMNIEIDSIVNSPGEGVNIKYYPSCSLEEITQLYENNSVGKYVELTILISDTVNTIWLQGDSIKLLSPRFLQDGYDKLEDEISFRILKYRPIGDSLHHLWMKATDNKERKYISNLNESLFSNTIGRANLDSSLLPAIESNLSNPLSFYALSQYLRQSNVFNFPIPKQRLLSLLDAMPMSQRGYGRWFDLKNEIKAYSFGNNFTGKTDTGFAIRKAPSFEKLLNPEGRPVRLENYEGKIIFLDFWASWCSPCVKEIPDLKRVYNRYKEDSNVVFISISIDENKRSWLSEIKKSGIEWINASDLKGDMGLTALKYGIVTVPRNYLIDKNGNIVAENVEIDKLSEKIAALY